MGRVSVAQAADRMGVGLQRVHQRIRDGSLPAQRIGHQWSIDEADLARLAHRDRPGRPLSPSSAWALVAVATGNDDAIAGVDASTRSRARRRWARLRKESTPEPQAVVRTLDHCLRNRASRVTLHASPRDLPAVRADDRIALSGLSRPTSDLSAADMVEGYVSRRDLGALTQEHLLTEVSPDRASVVLHAVPDEVDGLRWTTLVRSDQIAAADLAEHGGPREVREATRLWLCALAAAPPQEPR